MEDLDFHKVLAHPFSILRSCGLWFDKSATKSYKLYGYCVRFFWIDLFAFFQLLYVLKAESLSDLSDMLMIFCTYFLLSIKSASFMIKIDKIVALITELNVIISHLQSIEKTEMLLLKARVKQAQRTFRLFWASVLTVASLGPFMPLTAYLKNPDPPYQVPYKVWTPFDQTTSFYGFLVVTVYESINGVLFSQVVAAVDILPVFFFNTASGLFEELCERLSTMTDDPDEEKNAKKLECYIEVHLEIKSFLTKTQVSFSPMIFTQASISLVLICTSAFNLSKVSERAVRR